MPNHKPSRTGGLSGKAMLAVVLWGISFVLTREALETFNPFGLVTVRLLLGAAVLGLLGRLSGRALLPARSDRPTCIILGLVLAAHMLIQAHGLQHTSAIHTGWIIGLIPIPLALGAHLLGQQRIRPTGWIGITLGLVGVFIVTGSGMPEFENARLGDALQLVSCLTWTIYTLAGAGPASRSGALAVTLMAMIVATVVVALATAWTGAFVGPISAGPLMATAILGLLCSGLALYLWFDALVTHGATRIGVLLYLEPFVTLVAAVLLGDERVTAGAFVGGLCVLAGAWQVARGTSKPVHPKGTDRDPLDGE
ncbi:MAG: DMT family transporter [Planctomycetes bacterium]|nr:DMT family transporter [Planctomycetota bacterium]